MIEKNKWIDWLEIKGLSKRTIQEYMNYFSKLDLENFNYEYLVGWLTRFNNNVARAMLKNVLIYIRTNPDFPQEVKVFAGEFEIPKLTGQKKKRVPKILTRDQIHQLAWYFKTARERVMVLTTFYLGLRSQEIRTLTIDSFDWNKGTCRVIGKGNKERVIPLHPPLQNMIIEYINKEIGKNPHFHTIFPISSSFWRKKLGIGAEKCLGRWINPHLLRHSCGSFLHEQGMSLKEIAEFLGHSSINTTQIYVHLDKKKLNERIKGAFR